MIEIWKCKTCRHTFSKRYGDWSTCWRQTKKVALLFTVFGVISRHPKTAYNKLPLKQAFKSCSTVMRKCPKCGNDSILAEVKKEV